MSNSFFTVQEQYKERFYQLPKVFFTNPNYLKLCNDAKIAYAILRDRLDLSIKNNWFDAEGNIYFVYTVSELENILNCGNKKVIKIKKDLENVGLLVQKRQGLNKPNLLYLMKPEVTENDIYEIQKSEKDRETSNDKEVSKGHFQKCDNNTSRNVKMTSQDVLKRHANDTELSNTEFSDTDLNDTTTKKESSSNDIELLIKKIKDEFGIKITTKFKQELLPLLKSFDTEIIEYAIEYSSVNADYPKKYLKSVLQYWHENDVRTLNEAKSYSKKIKKTNHVPRELTPKWLEHRDKQNQSEDTFESKNHEQEKQAFLQHLKERWGD